MGHPTSRRDGTVWVAEDPDPDDPMLLTGRFSGHLERDDRMEEEFEDLTADDAIAWGHARAAVVLVRAGDTSYFSAGEVNPEPQEFGVWPPAGLRLERRRVSGFEALDRAATDPPMLWDVRVRARAPASLMRDADIRRFHDTLRAQPAARAVRAPAPGYPSSSAAFLVSASTHAQAQEVASRLAHEAFKALIGDRSFSGLAGTSFEVYPYRPDHPVRGSGVVY